MHVTVAELARRLDGVLEGDGGAVIRGVASLQEATAGDVTFLANPRYAALVAQTRASAVLVGRDWSGTTAAAVIRVADPDRACMQAAMLLRPPLPPPPPGVHPSAVIAPDAALGADVSIGPHCVIEAGARIGAGTAVMAGGYIGAGAQIGAQCRLYPHVSVREGVRIGDRCILHNGAVVGSDGFGYVREQGRWRKIPQLGTVEIGDDVEIGANATIDRARFGKTVIGNGVKIDNLVQIAHNVRVGDDTAIAAQTGIAGSSTIGRRVQIGGQAGVGGHLTVGDDSVVSAQAGVTKDVAPRSYVLGFPAMPAAKAKRLHAHLARLREWKERLAALEQQIAALRSAATDGKEP